MKSPPVGGKINLVRHEVLRLQQKKNGFHLVSESVVTFVAGVSAAAALLYLKK
jgi:hypothetical protein